MNSCPFIVKYCDMHDQVAVITDLRPSILTLDKQVVDGRSFRVDERTRQTPKEGHLETIQAISCSQC